MTPQERRLVLADFLENTVKPILDGATFDMDWWGTAGVAVPKHEEACNNLSLLSECGFAGCAVGWGYYCQELIKEGIPVRRVKYTVTAELKSDFVLLAEFFFGEKDEVYKAEYVFDPEYYDASNHDEITIDDVVKRLREEFK